MKHGIILNLPSGHTFVTASTPLLFAHRGCSAQAPENTFSAFRLVLQQKIPGVEFDVRVTKDGQPVVIHDATLHRLCGLKTRVADLTYNELRTVDVGSWFSPRFRDERVPLLREVLDLLGDKVYYDIELKVVTHKLALEVASLLAQSGLGDRAVVSSFSPRLFSFRHTLGPIAPILTPSYPLRYLGWRSGHYRDSAYLKPDIALFQRRRLIWRLAQRAEKHRMPWIPWTINNPETAYLCLERGAVGLISDDPERIAAALDIPLGGYM